jgi:hypothetical protein
VFNLGDRPADFRGLFRQLVAGVEPGREVVIGRSREPRRGILIQDAWLEVNDFDVATEDFHQMKYSLALSNTRPPTVAALLLPVGRVSQSSDGTTNPDAPLSVEQLFNAQGTLWACQWIGVDVQESGAVVLADVDVHLDWSGAFLDWWDWFVRWNQLEEFPDGSLTDGERQYA